MYQEFYANSHLMALPLIALSLFVGSFLAILYWVVVHLRDSSLPDYMAQLPLSDGPLVDHSGSAAENSAQITVDGRPIVEDRPAGRANARLGIRQEESSHE